MKDRIGIGWRPELAAGILSNLDQVDVVEVIADDYFDASAEKIRALRTLSKQVPVVLHGVSLGMASTARVDGLRLEKMARLLDQVKPDFWSEHLAFVRGGGFEIGHLAAPPRTAQTAEGCAENVDRAMRITGSRPLVENIATLIDPPASRMDEASWTASILSQSGADLLLDLHNLYANSVNFHFDPRDFLRRLPMHQVSAIHLSGGKWITAEHTGGSPEHRLLDDHLHDVPDPVYDLLRDVGQLASKTLTVILERDGSYPSFEELLWQLKRARQALAEGRAVQAARV
jgi:uncharacterized protein